MENQIEITVRSTEVDFLGHVNNAKFLEYLEWGREEWYRNAGHSFAWMAKRGVGTVTVNININYRGECGQGDILLVKTAPAKTGKSSCVFDQEIVKKDGNSRVSDARVTIVFIDLETRKSMPIPEYLRNKLS